MKTCLRLLLSGVLAGSTASEALAQTLAAQAPAAVPFALPSAVPCFHAASPPVRRLGLPSLPISRAAKAIARKGASSRSLVAARGNLAARPARARETLLGLFDGGRFAAEPESPVQGSESSPRPALAAAPLEGTARPEPRKPDFKRAAKLGLLLASLQIGLEYGVPLLCALLGHPLPSARGIVQGAAGALPAGVYLAYFLKGAFVAPVIEEILFRAVLMEGLIKGFERIGMRKASPWLAGLLSSGAFAAMHTNVADPVWMALYLCGALLYAYAYHHEGLASSASMHWLHNLFYQSQVLANNLYGPAAAMAAAAVLGLAYAAASLPAFKSLRRQWGKPVGDRSIRLPVFLPGSE